MFTVDDHRYMARALQLARRGRYTTDPNPRVGCVLVRDGEVVGEGWHVRAGEPHAEVHALRQAGEKARGATAYVSLEPCSHHGRTPPCADALVDAGIARAVVAMEDPFPKVAGSGIRRLQAAGIETAVGLMANEAEAVNPGFVSRMGCGRPYVRSKMAMSLDGRTAMADGESKWITSSEARADVQRLRARSSVIMTGIGTVLADDPRLNVRLDEDVEQPVRVVLDRTLRMPADSCMLALPGQTWIFTASDDQARRQTLEAAGARIFTVAATATGLVLAEVMKVLAAEHINEVLVEAGPTLNGALLAENLIDECVVYMAPHVMGDAGRGLFHLPGLENMAQRVALAWLDVRRVGNDLRLTLRPRIENE